MLKAGVHPKIVSKRLGHATVGITIDTYSHVLPGLQEAVAEKFDAIFNMDISSFKEGNVSKMLTKGEETERRPCKVQTCDILIKSHGVLVQAPKEVKTVFSTP